MLTRLQNWKPTMFQRDSAERVFWTAIQAGCSSLAVVGIGTDWSANKMAFSTALAATLGAFFAAIKAVAAKRIGQLDSASTSKYV